MSWNLAENWTTNLDYSDSFLNKLPEVNKYFKLRKGEYPFPYIILDDFFTTEMHQKIKNEMINIPIDTEDIYKGELIPPIDTPLLVGYRGEWHDAYRMYLDPSWYMKMNIFMESRLCDFLFTFWPKMEFTNEVLLDLHHHGEFSRDGFVHNDFDPSRFYGDEVPFGMDISYQYAGSEACDSPNKNIRYVQKSLAFIYWIGVGDKINMDEPLGGETAVFKSNDRQNPVAGFEMKENRLIMFEIGPNSYHGSRTNNTTYRDALFGWFHSEIDFMKKKYPNHDLCANHRTSFDPSKDKSFGKKVEHNG
tara:strand:+ start:409 stop:1323 length:915 start_codon:yes stop_codon:yes gene_type:complete